MYEDDQKGIILISFILQRSKVLKVCPGTYIGNNDLCMFYINKFLKSLLYYLALNSSSCSSKFDFLADAEILFIVWKEAKMLDSM